MNDLEFKQKIGAFIGQHNQSLDYKLCLIEVLKNNDLEVLKLLSKHANKALGSGFGHLRISNGAFREEAGSKLTENIFTELFFKAEVLLQQIVAYSILKDNNEEITFQAIEDVGTITWLFNKSVDALRKKEPFKSNSEIQSALYQLEIFHDIRNCICHSFGVISEKRKILIDKYNYSVGNNLQEEHIDHVKLNNCIDILYSNFCDLDFN